MTEDDLKAMPLHEIKDVPKDFFMVQRVINGWNYVYYGGGSKSVVFVPEILPIQHHVEPRLK